MYLKKEYQQKRFKLTNVPHVKILQTNFTLMMRFPDRSSNSEEQEVKEKDEREGAGEGVGEHFEDYCYF